MLPLAGGRRAVPASSKSSIGRSVGNIPGWKEEVEPFREQALFWHAVWVSAGRLNKGELHMIMARTRNQFHYAVRRTQRQADLTRAKKLFEASIDSEMELLKEMKSVKVGRTGGEDLPDCVAGADGEAEIVEKFREVYQALYNSAESSQQMNDIKVKVAELISVDSVQEVMKITGAKVKEAAGMMRSVKSDVTGGFTSDAILNAPDLFFIY